MTLFERDGDAFVATELSTGPWSRDALHGTPVTALLAHELAAVPGGEDMFPARVTVELFRPVGHTPMRVALEVTRPGKKVRVVEARLIDATSAGRSPVLARATLQQIRRAPVPLPARHREIDPVDPPPSLPEDEPAADSSMYRDDPPAFHNAAVEHRSSDGFFDALGPGFDWIRIHTDLLPGVALSPFERAVATADFGNGVGATLPVPEYLFVNPDLTVVLSDLPTDEWVALEARTRLGDHGVGYNESAIYGRNGRIGRSTQSLLYERRD